MQSSKTVISALLCAAGLIALATSASAQVAAPSLAPVGSFANPAALAWEPSSRVTAFTGEIEQTAVGAPANPALEADLLRLEGLWIGETFAAALERQSLDVTINPALGGGSLEIVETGISASARFAERYSVGIGRTVEELTDPVSSAEIETIKLGGTVRLGEIFYLGAMRFEQTQSGTAGMVTVEADRPVTGLGAAMLWHDGNNALHVEVSQTTAEANADPVFPIDEEETQRVVLEAKWAGVLLSFERATKESTSPAGAPLGEEEATTILVGWVPEQGLAVFGGKSETDSSDGAGNAVTNDEFLVVGVAWTF